MGNIRLKHEEPAQTPKPAAIDFKQRTEFHTPRPNQLVYRLTNFGGQPIEFKGSLVAENMIIERNTAVTYHIRVFQDSEETLWIAQVQCTIQDKTDTPIKISHVIQTEHLSEIMEWLENYQPDQDIPPLFMQSDNTSVFGQMQQQQNLSMIQHQFAWYYRQAMGDALYNLRIHA